MSWSTAAGSRQSARAARPARRCDVRRRHRVPGHAGAGQHPPSPLPVADPRLRRRPHAVRVAHDALPDLGPPRRRLGPHRRRPERSSSWPGPAARPRWTTTTCSLPTAAICWRAEIEAARTVGLRFLPTRGSMDLGESKGGLPPDHVVEEIDTILEATTEAIDRHHDPSPDSMLRIAVAPCSPFSVTGELLKQAADAGSRQGGPAAHAPCRDRRRGRLLPREVRLLAGGVRRVPGLARARRLARPRDPLRRRRHRGVGGLPDRHRPLSDIERPARSRHLPHPRPALGGSPGWAWRRRCRLQRGGVPCRGAPACGAVRPRRRRAAGADGPRRPGAGHAGRCAGARLGRPDRLARGREAGRRRAVATRHQRARQHRGSGRRAGAGFGSAAGAAAGAGAAGCPAGRDGRRRRGTAGGRPACRFGVVAWAGRRRRSSDLLNHQGDGRRRATTARASASRPTAAGRDTQGHRGVRLRQ